MRIAFVGFFFAYSSLAAAQQPAGAWLPVQIWAMPANAQAMPFPTPFWLWVVPPTAPPAQAIAPAPPAQSETPTPSAGTEIPAPPLAASAPAVALPTPASAPTPVPAQAAAPQAAPIPAPVGEPTEEAGSKPVIAATPAAPLRMAPVAKPKTKTATSRSGTRKTRKLCFKDGKLDVCP